MITVLTGPNSYAIAEAVRERIQAFEGDAEKIDAADLEPRHLPDLFMGVSLFASRRLIVLRGASVNKTLWPELEHWIERVPEETEILLIESSPDKRTRTYKLLQKHATIKEFSEPSEAELASWLQTHARTAGAEIQPDVLRYLISYVGRDQWRLKSELDKLLLAEKPVTKELIQDVAEPYPEATAFELLDGVFSGSESRVHQLLALLREREDPYQFFGLLSSQVLALYAIQCGGSRRPDEIAKDMALHPFVVRKLTGVASKLGKKGVERLIGQLAHADERIKTSGVDPWRQLEITLLAGH
jgi:DNA polymerase III subunit delta